MVTQQQKYGRAETGEHMPPEAPGVEPFKFTDFFIKTEELADLLFPVDHIVGKNQRDGDKGINQRVFDSKAKTEAGKNINPFFIQQEAAPDNEYGDEEEIKKKFSECFYPDDLKLHTGFSFPTK